MAIQFTKESQHGVDAIYWRVGKITIDYVTDEFDEDGEKLPEAAFVEILGYANAATAIARKRPVAGETIRVPLVANGLNVAAAENYIISLPSWQGAVRV